MGAADSLSSGFARVGSMSSTVLKESRSQQTLQSYLDALLQDAVIGLAESVSADEFQAAVL